MKYSCHEVIWSSVKFCDVWVLYELAGQLLSYFWQLRKHVRWFKSFAWKVLLNEVSPLLLSVHLSIICLWCSLGPWHLGDLCTNNRWQWPQNGADREKGLLGHSPRAFVRPLHHFDPKSSLWWSMSQLA